MHNGFQTRDESNESLEYVTSRWKLSWFSQVFCIFLRLQEQQSYPSKILLCGKLIKFFNHIHRLLCCYPLDKRSLPAFLARSLIALDHLIRYNVSEDLVDEWCDFLGRVDAVFISLVGGGGIFVFLDG
jgi:hypothetical protein